MQDERNMEHLFIECDGMSYAAMVQEFLSMIRGENDQGTVFDAQRFKMIY
jgi:hypothetical protein